MSQTIEYGSNARIGLVRDAPRTVLKYPHRSEHAQRSFECEKRAFALLGQHPYLVHPHATSELGLYFEYHPFRSIRYYYKHHGLPSIGQRYKWCHESVSGFAYVHSKNLVHHDISARNILVSSDLDIKICDFGSAVAVGEHPHGGGEFRYTFGRIEDEWERTFQYDLFCIGGLFYEIILGTPPYQELDRADIMARYKHRVFPSLAGIDPGYATIINNCWRDRYSSIQELESDLPRLLQVGIAVVADSCETGA
jgi:serine/threonine protein kinase